MINPILFPALLVLEEYDLKLLKLVIEAKTNLMSEQQTTYFNLVLVISNWSYYMFLIYPVLLHN